MQPNEEQKFSAAIRLLRNEQGWSQVELGAKVGLDGTAITRIESGDRGIRLGEAAKLAAVFGVGLDELVGLSASDGRPVESAIRSRLQSISEELRGLVADLT